MPRNVSFGERIVLLLYKLFNLVTSIIFYGFRVMSIVCWLFVLNNVASMTFGNIWYKLMGSGNFIGNGLLWFMNHVYLKSELAQYIVIFLSTKAFWLALLTSFGIRFARWLYNFARRIEYNHYIRKGYISNSPQVIVQQAPSQDQSLAIANMRAELAEQKLEIERLRNSQTQSQTQPVPQAAVSQEAPVQGS